LNLSRQSFQGSHVLLPVRSFVFAGHLLRPTTLLAACPAAFRPCSVSQMLDEIGMV
jgi:hypothetical protein